MRWKRYKPNRDRLVVYERFIDTIAIRMGKTLMWIFIAYFVIYSIDIDGLQPNPIILYKLSDVLETSADFGTYKYNINNLDKTIRPNVVEDLTDEIITFCGEDNATCKVEAVNAFMIEYFNYEKDSDRYYVGEFFQPPEVTIGLGVSGDCDDSAILIESMMQNLVNESYIINVPNHVLNLVCLEGIPISLDQRSMLFGDEAIDRITNYDEIALYGNKAYIYSENKWIDIEDVSCLKGELD